MNIFILDNNIEKCAQYHCDKHVGKMILESAQMLSTAVRLTGMNIGYKVTHSNHPCVLWTRKSLSNWIWLQNLTRALNKEYRFRFDTSINHKSYDLIQSLPLPKIQDLGLTSFTQVMPEIYKNHNPVIAYRNYYVGEKNNLLSWNNKRAQPFWLKSLIEDAEANIG